MIGRRHTLLALGATLALPGAGRAQAYPSKPLRFVVPYPAGGGADSLARLIALKLGESLQQNVVVENKPGANGSLGAREGAAAAPDGHTLVLVTDGLYSIFPHLLPVGASNPMTSLTPVIHLVDAPLVLAARPGLGVTNVAELIALAKNKPGELTYAANNTTSTHYLAMAVFQKMAGIQMRHIPFAGAGASLPQLIGGQLDLIAAQPNAALAAATSRGVHYLAVSTATRYAGLPDVPTIAETVKGYDEPVAMGLMVTKGTPASAVTTLNRAVHAILLDSRVRQTLLETSGATPTGGTVEQFQQLIDRQFTARGVLIKELNIGKD